MANLIRWAERLFLIVLSAGVIWRVVPHIPEHPHMILFLTSELLGVVLLLIQRRGEWTTDAFPVAIAFLGTGLGLLVVPSGTQLVPEWVSQAFVLSGAVIALLAKAFLGRSFGIVPANRGVKHSGVYRIVRHPMYAGYIVSHIGFLLLFFSAHNVMIYIAVWIALWLRARAEEQFLEADAEYRSYREKVRYRLIPGIA